MRKLAAHDRAQLVIIAYEGRLVVNGLDPDGVLGIRNLLRGLADGALLGVAQAATAARAAGSAGA